MTEKSNHSKIYTATDIEKYLSGELSSLQMNELERAALDDPLLADAIEGMELAREKTGSTTIQTDLNEIKTRIQKRSEARYSEKSYFQKNWWQVAAIFLIIVGSGIFFLWTPSSPGPETANKTITPSLSAVVADSTVAAPVSSPKTDSVVKGDVAIVQHEFVKKAINLFHKPEPVKIQEPVATGKAKDSSIDIASSVKVHSEPINPDSVGSKLMGKVAGVSVSSSSNATTQKINLLTRNFSGRIADSSNRPVPYATLSFNNKKNAVSADENGFFKLELPKFDSVAYVTVAAVGFQTANARLTNNPLANNIQLSPSASSLNEVVITGYSSAKKETLDRVSEEEPADDKTVSHKKQKVIVQNAVPSIGWDEYKSYLDTHKKLASPSSGTEYEVISFKVNKTGVLSSFKIEKSLSPAHDTEAIRLVKEGPAWKLLSGKSARATLIIAY